MENYGMDIRDMADILDLMVVTAYPYAANEGIDSCRNNYTVPYHVKMNSRGTPVFTCEAPGFSTIWYSEEMLRRYFKVSLYSNLINGSTGVMPWVFQDFEESLWHKPPLNEKLVEPAFGVLATDGRLKPSGEETETFAKFVKQYEIGQYRPRKAKAAVLVPDGYYKDIRNSFQKIYIAYLLAKGCSIDVDLVWSSEELSGYQLLMLPSASGIKASEWDRIRRFVENGGMIYHTFENGALNIYYSQLFGIEVLTSEADYGYNRLNVQKEFGHWNPVNYWMDINSEYHWSRPVLLFIQWHPGEIEQREGNDVSKKAYRKRLFADYGIG